MQKSSSYTTPKLRSLVSIFSHLHHVKKAWLPIGGLLIGYVAIVSGEPYFYKVVVDILQSELTNPTGKLPMRVLMIIGIWVVLLGLSVGFRYAFAYVLLTHQHDDWRHFILASMRKMLLLPIDYHLGIQHGEKQKIIDRGAEAVWQAGDNLILKVLPQILITISLIIIGAQVDIRMLGIALVLLPIIVVSVFYTGKRAHTNQRAANKYWDKVFGRISDSFTNLSITRIFDRQEHELSILSERLDTASSEQMKVRKNWILFHSLGQAYTYLAKIFILALGIVYVYDGSITLGTLLFFLAFADRLYSPIMAVFEAYQTMMINIAHYEKMDAIYTMDDEKNTGTKVFSTLAESIRFEGVDFTYPSNDRKVLSYIDIEIQKGQRIALVGHTGSGKSTITQLLMRFYEPSSGTIRIDGTNIYDFTLESYRQRFAAVLQDTTLFNESIRHNLEYVRDGISEAELIDAARKANILDFIESLPEKWETEVGERGLKLSGGEKQRIAIARAILADPEILILDEATSALDTKTERLVQDAFDHLMEGRTSIIIAHRLSTIQGADVIYLMDHGRIIAKGSHRELYKDAPLYREMVDMQHDGFVGEE